MTKLIFLISALLALTVPRMAAAPSFEPGQVWMYETRASESASRVAIMRIDTYPDAGSIIHVAVLDLRLRRSSASSAEPWQIGHLRMTEKALRKSVTKLDPTTPAPAIPGFEEEYSKWKAAADSGDIQRWHLPLRDIVQQMEKWVQSGKTG